MRPVLHTMSTTDAYYNPLCLSVSAEHQAEWNVANHLHNVVNIPFLIPLSSPLSLLSLSLTPSLLPLSFSLSVSVSSVLSVHGQEGETTAGFLFCVFCPQESAINTELARRGLWSSDVRAYLSCPLMDSRDIVPVAGRELRLKVRAHKYTLRQFELKTQACLIVGACTHAHITHKSAKWGERTKQPHRNTYATTQTHNHVDIQTCRY